MNIYKLIIDDCYLNAECTLFTSLTPNQIESVMESMTCDDELYELQDYISALASKYPNATVQTDEDFEILTFK
tara:strand:+ start:324 stop:542 length:219 start_codon:yes stop_codon:yes gene_type:complete